MNAKRWIPSTIGAALLLSMPGCATVMSGRHADVTFYSNVPEACVVIRDKRGEQVAVAQSQSKIALKRKDRLIFPAQYTATFAAPGYQPVEVPIRSKVNPWVYGNVLFGYAGLVGLAVDNATGAAWSPKEATFYQELSPLGPTGGPAFTAAGPGSVPAGPIYTASAPTYNGAGTPSALPTWPVTTAGTTTPAATTQVPQTSPGIATPPIGVAPATRIY